MNAETMALLAWIPICTCLFGFTTPVRAVVLAYMCGWLILPMGSVEVQGFWDIDKVLATNIGVVVGTVLFCPDRIRGFRWNIADAAILLFALTALLSSVSNGLGIYNGISAATHSLIRWAIPYWFGRAMFRKENDLIQAGQIIVIGASIAAVFAVWEWRMSPQVHSILYGNFQHSFSQHRRWGFFRPVLCFPHALSLGVFMVWTSLIALAMYRARVLRTWLGLPPYVLVAMPTAGVLFSMSFGPWGLFLAGAAMLVYLKSRSRRWVIMVPMLLALYWMGGRYTNLVNGAWTLPIVGSLSEDREGSLYARLEAETALLDHAASRPLLGWGGAGRNQLVKDSGKSAFASDALWVIWTGKYGLIGLCAYYFWWCWPIFACKRASQGLERNPVVMAIVVAIGLQCVNSVFNGILSPLLTMMCGAASAQLIRYRAGVR